jgi:hypothetical protein
MPIITSYTVVYLVFKKMYRTSKQCDLWYVDTEDSKGSLMYICGCHPMTKTTLNRVNHIRTSRVSTLTRIRTKQDVRSLDLTLTDTQYLEAVLDFCRTTNKI